jgi:hypothetical protein
MPARNCAPKLAPNSSSFVSSKRSCCSRSRPNARTSAWPVKASSTCAFRVPVWVHWAMNRFFDRAVIALIPNTATGIVKMTINDMSSEIEIIRMSTPTSVRVEMSVMLIVCCRLWARLSMSLVTRLSRSPRGVLSMYASGKRLSLSSTWARSLCIDRWITPASTRPWL